MFIVAFVAMLAYFASLAARQGTKSNDRTGGAPAPATASPIARAPTAGAVSRFRRTTHSSSPAAAPRSARAICSAPRTSAAKPVAAGDHQVVPLGARGATSVRLGVCQPCGEEGCQPR